MTAWVINVVTRWTKLQFEDFKKEWRMMKQLDDFLLCGNQAGYQKEMETIRDTVARQRTRLTAVSASTSGAASFAPGLITPPASPVSISSFTSSTSSSGSSTVMLSSTISVLSCLDAIEVAQYLTLADFTLFKNVTAHEYLFGSWRRGEAVGNEFAKILTMRVNMRRDILRKLIRIAKLCIEWKNFHTAMVITMALECSTIQRLDHIWQNLSSRDIQSFQQLKRYMDVSNNMHHYRRAFDQAVGTSSAVMPFFPLVLKDLTFFMDGNPTVLPHQPPLINFDKCRELTRFLSRLANYASVDYWFASDLDHFPFLPHVSPTRPPRCQPPTRFAPLDRVAELIESKRVQ
ncbi:ras guanine nucleotide exchange factor domain-containing protein [Dichotomocladium elegans]|nr:ras guanine nucleotide exchange factor domain-containing protein [Dichotomocladium elegans]